MTQNDDKQNGPAQPDSETAGNQAAESAGARAANDDLIDTNGSQAETAAPEGGQAGGGAADAAPGPLEQAQAEIADLKDKLLRTMADAENLRRRTERDMADLRKYAVTDFARDIVGVADNLQRAIAAARTAEGESAPTGSEVAQLLEGVTLTEKELRHVLEKHNITAIDPLGEKLDPNLHQAMVQIDHPDAEAGTIVQVMQIGYRIHDRLLRAAMVAVAKGNGGGNAAGQQVDTEA
jgi:molecular chaperone GrpE